MHLNHSHKFKLHVYGYEFYLKNLFNFVPLEK